MDAFAAIDLGLAVQRQVIAILADQDMREQAGAGSATLDRQDRRRCLMNRLAAPARDFRADMLDDLEVARNVFQHLALVLAHRSDFAAALRAGGRRGVQDGLARQMVRQRPARRLAFAVGQPRRRVLLGLAGSGRRRNGGLAGLQLLDRQLELGNLAIQLLRGSAELHPAQLRQLHLQLLDFQRLDLEGLVRQIALHAALAQQPSQAVDIVGKLGGVLAHIRTVLRFGLAGPESWSRSQPASSGRQVRAGCRQSMPSSSIDSCAGVSTARS